MFVLLTVINIELHNMSKKPNYLNSYLLTIATQQTAIILHVPLPAGL